VSYLAFVWTPNGYQFREREGDAPPVGTELEDENSHFVVTKVASSPLPGDERRCAYLQPVR
jgi:hypothetical protein